jgi:hypothetical protein
MIVDSAALVLLFEYKDPHFSKAPPVYCSLSENHTQFILLTSSDFIMRVFINYTINLKES